MKRLAYVAGLSVMIALVFAVIASAQDSPDQSSSDQNNVDQTQSPTPGEQTTPSEPATPSEQTVPAQDTSTVSIQANAFDPPELNVAPGTTVTFVNEDTVPHTVSLDGLFDSYEIPPGSSFPLSLEGAGTVTYHDVANPEMQGTIVVGEASQGEATTPEEPATTPEEAATTEEATTPEEAVGESQQTTDGSTELTQDSV